MKHIGHPLIGDFLYGNNVKQFKYKNIQNEFGTSSNLAHFGFLDRQALHSYRLSFIHPITKEKMLFEIPLSPDILNMLDNLKIKV